MLDEDNFLLGEDSDVNNSTSTISLSEYEEYIVSVVEGIDEIIDLDFTRTDNPDDSTVDFYLVNDVDLDDSTVVGLTNNWGTWFEILLKDGQDESEQKSTIIHEWGHVLGLDHPDDDGFNMDFTVDDTVMSYNIGSNGWNDTFTSADIEALRQIWGDENDSLSDESEVNDVEDDSEVNHEPMVGGPISSSYMMNEGSPGSMDSMNGGSPGSMDSMNGGSPGSMDSMNDGGSPRVNGSG